MKQIITLIHGLLLQQKLVNNQNGIHSILGVSNVRQQCENINS